MLFAHTLLAHLTVLWWTARRLPTWWVYTLAYVGHILLDRIWYFPDTLYWPLRGRRFHVWGKRGAEQKDIGQAYWVTFTRRRELWLWELGGLLALLWFVWRHQLYKPPLLWKFMLTGRVNSRR